MRLIVETLHVNCDLDLVSWKTGIIVPFFVTVEFTLPASQRMSNTAGLIL